MGRDGQLKMGCEQTVAIQLQMECVRYVVSRFLQRLPATSLLLGLLVTYASAYHLAHCRAVCRAVRAREPLDEGLVDFRCGPLGNGFAGDFLQ
jgi:hypothetical protein